MSQTETVDAPTPSRTKAFSRMERIRLANKMTFDTKPGPSSNNKNKECGDKGRKQELGERHLNLANAALIAAGLIANDAQRKSQNIDHHRKFTTTKCLSDTEIHSKSGVMYPFLCHIAHYKKMTHIRKKTISSVGAKNGKKLSRIGRGNIYQNCYANTRTIPLLQQKDPNNNKLNNEACRKCLTWFMSQPTHKKMGILSSNSVSYFPQLLKEINRKGGIHKVFCHWDQLQNEYLISLIRKRNMYANNYYKLNKKFNSNNHSNTIVVNEMIYNCDSTIMKNVRAAEQRCAQGLVSISNNFNANERSMTFLPEWLDSENFLYDVSTITHGQFLSKYPSDWVNKEEFWKHNPWERRVEKRQRRTFYLKSNGTHAIIAIHLLSYLFIELNYAFGVLGFWRLAVKVT